MRVIDVCKELWIAFSWSLRKVRNTQASMLNDIKELEQKGVVSHASALDFASCEVLRNEIDTFLSSKSVNIWSDELGADERIYGYETISSNIHNIIDIEPIRKLGEHYLGKKLKSYFLMVARLRAVDGNLGSGGGWHRDSPFTHQFKAIYYLSEVSELSGPFSYIEGSHSSKSKFGLMGSIPLNKMRFTSEERKLIPTVETEFTAPEGSLIFADTRGVHRGAPIKQGERYALFFYFYENEIPKHFHPLLQDV